MNVIQMSITRAIREIPRMILEDAFLTKEYPYRQSPKTLEQCIKEEVIYKVVLPDLNLANGVYSFIPLYSARVENVDYNTKIYHIPKEATGGRAILTPITIGFASPYLEQGYMANCGNSMINRKIQNLITSISDLEVTTNSRLELIAENTVIVYGAIEYQMGYNTYLVCILEHDDQLSYIKPRSIPLFTQLIGLAIKGYIYTKLVLDIDRGRLYGGHDLGVYKEIVLEYRDAWQQYTELLQERIGKLLYMNSTESMQRHVRYMLGSSRR